MAEWISRTSPNQNFKEALSDKEVPLFVYDLLKNRGIAQDQIQNFLYPKLADLRDPFLIAGMKETTEKLCAIYENKEPICIYADFDLDGTSGLALFKDGLEKLGFTNVLGYQPQRLSQGYGIHNEAIDEICSKNIKTLLTIDVGITATQAIAYAKSKGMFVIVTDHHLPHGESLPPADILVNANIKPDHPLSHLCGAGVAFYLLWALSRTFKEKKWIQEFDIKSFLDCFVIGTITDMVPLVDENRVLVKHGLVQLAQTKRPGLKVLLEELGLNNRKLAGEDVGISFAPKLNALSRMEMGLKPIDVFFVETEVAAKLLVKDIFKNNSLRIELQKDALEEAQRQLVGWNYKNFVFVVSDTFHKGVIGLIATQLTKEYNKPAFVGTIDPETGAVVNSSRRSEDSDVSLVDVLENSKELLVRFGGHPQAAGFEFEHKNWNQLLENIENYYEQENGLARQQKIEFDMHLKLSDLNESFMKWFDFLGPYGVGFAKPIFLLEKLKILKLRELKGGHIKYTLSDGEKNIDALIFSPKKSQKWQEGSVVDVLGSPQWNYFAGKSAIQLLIQDLRLSSEG